MELITENDLQSCGISKSTHILCAFSGGADSTALLLELFRLYKAGRLAFLAAAHFEHGIRGEESYGDMLFCRRLAEELNIPFFCERAQVPETAAKEHVSLETAARKLRYEFLERTAATANCDCIALAHHAQDQAETLLFHLIRGAGLTGLTGISPRNGKLVRPLLKHTKEEILSYVNEMGQGYRTDSTNALLDSDRNRIRLSLFPVLKDINPRAAEHICRTADKLRADDAFLEELTDKALLSCAGKRSAIADAAPVIRDRILLRLIKTQTMDYTETDVEKLRALLYARSGQIAELTGGIKVRAEGDGFFFFKGELFQNEPLELSIGTPVPLPSGGTLLAEITASAKLPCPRNEGYADVGKLSGPLIVRPAGPGERFTPYGLKGSKLFSDFYTDKKIPVSKRNNPVVFDNEKAVYVCGFTVDDRVKVTDKTQNFIHFIYSKGD